MAEDLTELKMVSLSVKHDSAEQHVAGAARYVDDIPEPRDLLHIAFGQSDKAHARILAMDLEGVRRAPGVAAVFTAADIPGENNVGPVRHDDRLFAEELVEYAGQSLFAVAATSVEAARQYLLDLGAPTVAAVGMRLGATLAATRSAAEPFSSLVLWDPCLSGRTFLREGEALYGFGENAEVAVPDDGLRHTPGFQYDADTATALRTLDLGRLDPGARLAERVLLLTRDDRPTGTLPPRGRRIAYFVGSVQRPSNADDSSVAATRRTS